MCVCIVSPGPQTDGLAGLLQWVGGGLAALYTNILPYLPPRHTNTRARWGMVWVGMDDRWM